jgi:CDP-diacylglycerol--glycerol-3-phosphate 3-phosphatidyltransferase
VWDRRWRWTRARGHRYSAGVSEKSSLSRDLRTAPNLVSLARVVFIYVAIGLWFQGHFSIGLVIGVLAGLSDYLDGYLARRLGQTTRIGGLLDQAADILFISGCIFIFVRDGTWPGVLLLVVIFRETVVMNLRASAAEMGFSLPSIFLGKWASNWMFWSLALMGATRTPLIPAPYNLYGAYVAHFGMVVGVVSSLITAGIYLKSYARQYRGS